MGTEIFRPEGRVSTSASRMRRSVGVECWEVSVLKILRVADKPA
jgi:hypothetical protein